MEGNADPVPVSFTLSTVVKGKIVKILQTEFTITRTVNHIYTNYDSLPP